MVGKSGAKVNLGETMSIQLKEQEARYILGALSYIEKNLGSDELEDLIEHLAEAGVDPEADTEVDLLAQARASITNRQAFKPFTFEQARLHSICHLPPVWMLTYIEMVKKAQTSEEEEQVYQLFDRHNKTGRKTLEEWVKQSYQGKQKAESQAYGYLMAMIQMGILDADHAGEILQDYRPGGKYNP